jgi:hypothetical protein
MKVKVIWGFVGNALLLGSATTSVKAGQVFDDVEDEYAHALIGKGLAVELDAKGKPQVAKPDENKSAAPKEDKSAADKAAADKAAAHKAASDKEAADKALADKSAADKAAAKETK